MIKQFSHNDIKQWADFSGDHNKVHFDRDIALKNGLKDIIVQGMLVMMDAKLKYVPHIKADTCINFYLKQPVYVNEQVHYQFIERNNKFSCKILDKEQEVITSKASHIEQPIFDTPANKIDIGSDFFRKQVDLFRQEYPHIRSNWLLIDALLFSVCFKYQKGDPFYKKALKITKEPDKRKVVTYQADQKIYIPERLLSNEEIDLSRLTVFFEDKDIIKEDYFVYSLLDYQVLEGDQLLYQSSVGSMTKAHRT